MRRLIPFRKQNRFPLYLSPEERDGLRVVGNFNASLMDYLRPHVQAGTTTNQLDRLAEGYTRDHGHIPACLGYNGYSKSICTSINSVVCHGIPNDEELKPGDIINVDCTTIVNGWYGDSSETFLIEPVSKPARDLVQATFDSLWLAIDALRPGCSVMEIGVVISRHGWKQGYGVVENFQGHGIGRSFHQEPGIPHVPVRRSQRDILAPGASFTIEPMLNIGGKMTRGPLSDGWTILTEDGSLSAQFEHQILMTEEGPEILTLTRQGPQRGHIF
ncbi:MAG TPA: type I methionyl aminopeptidase [Planctomicrobium sp.]|nr:type I methionyl aminopeptidase [Planctomicrobium sp.]